MIYINFGFFACKNHDVRAIVLGGSILAIAASQVGCTYKFFFVCRNYNRGTLLLAISLLAIATS